uniref:Uncharacterized protein n=1 Tax=Chelydra serpentina TaxID=8475 RepID=A0A8C3SV15_CHESE
AAACSVGGSITRCVESAVSQVSSFLFTPDLPTALKKNHPVIGILVTDPVSLSVCGAALEMYPDSEATVYGLYANRPPASSF